MQMQTLNEYLTVNQPIPPAEPDLNTELPNPVQSLQTLERLPWPGLDWLWILLAVNVW
jgi:hypothetical protein